MLIDWFTVIAQIGNFLILVWLMKRYLYTPILGAIDAREAKIAAAFKAAEAKQAEAAQECVDFRQKNAAFEQQCATLMENIRKDMKIERQRLLDEARNDAGVLRARLAAAVQSERAALGNELAVQVRHEVFCIARQTLADLATVSVEAQMCKVFVERLRTLDDAARAGLAAALKSMAGPALVRSRFELASEQREEIGQALQQVFGAAIALTFDTRPGLVCGIELRANGQKLAWSIDDYLGSLDARLNALLAQPAKAGDKTDATGQAT